MTILCRVAQRGICSGVDEISSSAYESIQCWRCPRLLEVANPKLFPVYKSPIYLPFGFSFRRCAGETLNYFVIQRFKAKLKRLRFIFLAERPLGTKRVPVAPFTSYYDTIFVDF